MPPSADHSGIDFDSILLMLIQVLVKQDCCILEEQKAQPSKFLDTFLGETHPKIQEDSLPEISSVKHAVFHRLKPSTCSLQLLRAEKSNSYSS